MKRYDKGAEAVEVLAFLRRIRQEARNRALNPVPLTGFFADKER
jgi:hypothetical protein